MINRIQKQLLDFLLQQGLLKTPQIQEIEGLLQSSSDKPLREVLTKGGFLEAERLAQFEANFWHLPYINILKEEISEEALSVLPLQIGESHSAVCFKKEGNLVSIALANPDDYYARESIDFWAVKQNFDVKYYICSMNAWQEILRRYQAFGEKVKSVLSQVEEEREESQAEEDETEKMEEVIKSAPVAQIISMIVKQAIKSKASDIHIEPYGSAARVRFRVDGVLQTVLNLPPYIYESLISRIKVLSNLKIDETRIPQDGRFKFEIGDAHYDLRVSTMPLAGKEKATLRVLDTSGRTLTLEQLGFSAEVRKMVDTALKQTFGMILVTGPTGSGKSTTLSSLLSMMNEEGTNIITLEDPIEYYLPGINQSQIRPDVKFTFASGLRAILRQDPDIIMVGEIRDAETAEMAVHAALTGHLLFSTLHTNDAVGTIPRLLDMHVEPFILASTLTLIVAQRLCRRVCTKCKETYEIPEDMAERIRAEFAKRNNSLPEGMDLNGKLMGFRGKGCSACRDTGYSGRVVISEALPITQKMRVIISDGFKPDDVEKEVNNSLSLTLVQDGVIKALQGITTLEEVFRVSKEIEEQ